MPINPQDRTKLERHWKEKWLNAQVELETARVHLRSIEGDLSGVNRPDGGQAYQSALKRETSALIEYSRVLRIYANLVLKGKLPDDEDPSPVTA